MPDDQPTSSAGAPGPAVPVVPTFRGGVERVDETTAGVPAVPAAPVAPSPSDPSQEVRGPQGEGSATVPRDEPDAVSPAAPPATDVPAARLDPVEPPTRTGPAPAHTGRRGGKVRARKVRRIVRHIEPWSVLKISVLFYAALFLIVCVASALLWGAARAAGTVDNVESFITSVGGFGNCEPIDGAAPVTTTTVPSPGSTAPVDQLDPSVTDTSVPDPALDGAAAPGDNEDCRAGEELVGEFRFEDTRIFEAFALGGIVLVLAGSAANVVLVLLFNLMSDLTGGVRMTVIEEDPPPRARTSTGSPPTAPRD